MLTIANVEMAAAWDGHEGDHWTEHADRYDTAGRRHRRFFLARGLVGPGDAVLDIGCGAGRFTCDVARLATPGPVLGLDLSARMIDLARHRSEAEGLAGVRFEQADAQVHPFEAGAWDVAVSSFGAMSFNDRAAAFASIATALRPGGRLAMLAWRELGANEWLMEIREALAAGRTLPVPPMGGPGPFGLADVDGATAVLTSAGFGDVCFEESRRRSSSAAT